ncbi:bifunctional 3-oxoadipate enol-lactonase/4-carboxymuconolactone decarboxylase PcaDC [Jiulongibacter sediminis]|uniref:AraC family transcriptional regulator n=1 Tax=Jiulongibacter sediminis TaxID=1605367 RepID=A0A0P7C6B0_9BACT|nr:3-oxoadipate enol-lactonase [Jiulongibacter sediminis]KPM48912.1 AraC family transcriptional regulator [Jiulongibacter sediminis]TBX25441.1 AraC family transcriptional regulator [Jiulongibacter sediminis]
MNYKLEGTPNSPVLIFSNSLGSTMDMWEELVPFLLPYFRVLRYDTRGHGGSPVTTEPYTIDQLGQDVIDLMDRLSIEKAFFCGLSMGGLIGQWLGIHRPKRFYKIVLSNTGAKIGDDERWNTRISTISENGMESIVDASIDRWFTDEFKAKTPKRVAQTYDMFLSSPVIGYSNCCAAIRDADFRDSLSKFSAEALVITGDQDLVTNVEHAEFLVSQIQDAELKILPARHLAATELPEEYSEALIDFFVGESTFERGMHVRRTVLGNAHVDRANSKINELNGDFQEFISHYAWGEIWTRPGLSKPNRSLITLAMLIALNREAEFKMHVKAAFNNGVSLDEIKEVIMQASLYCGLPAANEAFHKTEEVLKEIVEG